MFLNDSISGVQFLNNSFSSGQFHAVLGGQFHAILDGQLYTLPYANRLAKAKNTAEPTAKRYSPKQGECILTSIPGRCPNLLPSRMLTLDSQENQESLGQASNTSILQIGNLVQWKPAMS